jgi:phosphate:Na+ symporter
VAFKVTHFALIPVAIGFAMLFCFKNDTVRHYGHMIMGLGLVFFGMQLMSDGTKPLRDYPPFIDLMSRMDDPLLGILVAAVFTGIIQSSSAAIGIVIVLASQGFITLEAGIALALGANIGTCVTAMLASLGKPREAVRSAAVHILFKIVGVLIWVGVIAQLAFVVRWISPSYPELETSARMAAETPRQIANAHTLFNVANTLIFIWFTGPLASLMRWLIPDKREKEQASYLDELLIRTPSLAMHMIRLELGRLGATVLWMVREGIEPVLSGSASALGVLRTKEIEVDLMHGAIIRYLGQLSKESLDDDLTAQVHDSMAAANYLENMGDMVATHMAEAGSKRLKRDLRFSPETQAALLALHGRVAWAAERAVEALVSSDRAMALEVIDAKDEVNGLVVRAEEQLANRLTADEPNRLANFKIESDLVESLKRTYYFAKRIAKIVVDNDGNAHLPEVHGPVSTSDGDRVNGDERDVPDPPADS